MCALTKDEVIAQLQKEVRILLHLAGKVDRSTLDYRPTPKQRSTIELLRYLMGMGPTLVRSIKSGSFDVEAWQAMTAKANAADFDQVLAMIRAQESEYASLLASWTEADFRGSIELFGRTATRAVWLLELVLNGCAAYRTQLFCYLKSCGREELSTSNLWRGWMRRCPPNQSRLLIFLISFGFNFLAIIGRRHGFAKEAQISSLPLRAKM